MVSAETKNIRYFIIASLAVLALLVFSNLGNQYLWQDEAENAVIAGNILKFGYPKAFDGTLLVISDIGYRPGYTWIFQPWLQNYVTAGSFLIFGKSTYSARFPFALFGVLSFLVSYSLAKRLFSAKVARISSVILMTSVPYLLMIRSARYYSLALFFSLILIHGYLDYVEGRKYASFSIAASSFLLFNSNFGMFFPLFTGLALHRLIFYYSPKNLYRDLRLIVLVGLVTVPVFIYFKGWMHKVPLSADFVTGNIKFYLRSINRYIAPIRFMAVVYVILSIWKRKFIFFKINSQEKTNLSLILFIFIVGVLFMGIAKFRSLRYIIYLIPLLIIFESYILARWMDYRRILPVACIIVLITTDLLHHSLTTFLAKPVRSYLADYIYEITHDYDGPIEGIVKYLKQHAGKGDTVMISYGDCAVSFYTGLKVDNRIDLFGKIYPDWFIYRDYWTPEEYLTRPDLTAKYTKIVLDYPDLRWENRPDDLGYHNFRTVKDCPKKVVIYRRKGSHD